MTSLKQLFTNKILEIQNVECEQRCLPCKEWVSDFVMYQIRFGVKISKNVKICTLLKKTFIQTNTALVQDGSNLLARLLIVRLSESTIQSST